jgi:hypothetical protein
VEPLVVECKGTREIAVSNSRHGGVSMRREVIRDYIAVGRIATGDARMVVSIYSIARSGVRNCI